MIGDGVTLHFQFFRDGIGDFLRVLRLEELELSVFFALAHPGLLFELLVSNTCETDERTVAVGFVDGVHGRVNVRTRGASYGAQTNEHGGLTCYLASRMVVSYDCTCM